MPRKKPTPPPEPTPEPRPPMTYNDVRERVGLPIFRQIATECGLKAASTYQPALLAVVIPAKRRLCMAGELEALATKLNNVARELRAEDEP